MCFMNNFKNGGNYKGKYGMRILTIVCHEIASDWKLIKSGVPRNQNNIKGNVKQYVI